MPNLADQIREPGGPTSLDVKAIPDLAVVTRSGAALVGTPLASLAVGTATLAATATTALGLTEPGGPTALTMASVADLELLARSGTTIDGIAQSALRPGGLREPGGPTSMAYGAIPDASILWRTSGTVAGVSQALLSYLLQVIAQTITPVNAATKSWDTGEANLGVTYVTAQCDITLPDETQILNWVPLTDPPRRIYKLNTTAFSVGLIAPPNITINGDAAGTDMTTIPGFNADPSATVMAPYCLVYRLSATAYYVMGAQS